MGDFEWRGSVQWSVSTKDWKKRRDQAIQTLSQAAKRSANRQNRIPRLCFVFVFFFTFPSSYVHGQSDGGRRRQKKNCEKFAIESSVTGVFHTRRRWLVVSKSRKPIGQWQKSRKKRRRIGRRPRPLRSCYRWLIRSHRRKKERERERERECVRERGQREERHRYLRRGMSARVCQTCVQSERDWERERERPFPRRKPPQKKQLGTTPDKNPVSHCPVSLWRKKKQPSKRKTR